MPAYTVTDKETGKRYLVDASNKASAISHVASSRLECSDYLNGSEALRASQEPGIIILSSEPELPMSDAKGDGE